MKGKLWDQCPAAPSGSSKLSAVWFRCFEGRVYESYGYEGGGKMLKDLGVIFGDTLPGQKARIKLALAINSTISKEEIKKQF